MFKFSVPWQITSKQAMDLQDDLSYACAGYGFYGFVSGIKESYWYCSDSCD